MNTSPYYDTPTRATQAGVELINGAAQKVADATGIPVLACWERIEDGGVAGSLNQGYWFGTRKSGENAAQLIIRGQQFGPTWFARRVMAIMTFAEREADAGGQE
jgi:hypothetical protein